MVKMPMVYANGQVGMLEMQIDSNDRLPELISIPDGTEFRLEKGRYLEVTQKYISDINVELPPE